MINEENDDREIIACVKARKRPATVRTLTDWLIWQAEEEIWMEQELLKQREAWFELRNGATKN